MARWRRPGSLWLRPRTRPPHSPLQAGAPLPPYPRALRVPLRRAVSVLALTRCGMVAARLSREVSLRAVMLCRLAGYWRPLRRRLRGLQIPAGLGRLCCCGSSVWGGGSPGWLRRPHGGVSNSPPLRCRGWRLSFPIPTFYYSGGGFGSALSGWARTERAPAGSPAPRIPGGGVPRPADRPPPACRRRAVVATLPLFCRLTRCGLGVRVGRCHGLRPLRVSPVGSFARYSARPTPQATPSASAASARSGLGRVLIGRAPPLLAPPLPRPEATALPHGSMDFRRGPFIETACAARSPRPTPARLAFDETFPRLKFIDFDGRNDHFPYCYP